MRRFPYLECCKSYTRISSFHDTNSFLAFPRSAPDANQYLTWIRHTLLKRAFYYATDSHTTFISINLSTAALYIGIFHHLSI